MRDRLGTRPSEFWRALCAALVATGRTAYVIGDMGYEIRDEEYPVTGVRVGGRPPVLMAIGSQYGGVPLSKANADLYDVDDLVWEFAERWDGLGRSLEKLTGQGVPRCVRCDRQLGSYETSQHWILCRVCTEAGQ